MRGIVGGAVVTAAIMVLQCGSASAAVWNVSADWSDVSNANGAWSYWVGSTLAISGTRGSDSFATPPGAPKIWWSGSQNYRGWSQSNGSESAVAGGPADLLPGDVYGHADAGVPVTIRWTSPVAADVQVTGGAWMVRSLGRSEHWQVVLNGSTVAASGDVWDGDPYSRANPNPFNFTETVQPGDTLAFIVSPNSGYPGDYVAVNMTVSTVPEPTLLGLLPAGMLVLRRRQKL